MGQATAFERMLITGANRIADGAVLFVGFHWPMLMARVARRLHAPNIVVVYENGIVEDRLTPIFPTSPCDLTAAEQATTCASSLEALYMWLGAGRVQMTMLEAAIVDRFGNINTTVIGDYDSPKTRLPGSGGACEIAINARNVFVIMRQSSRSFVEKIDFRTSPGNLGGAEQAERIRKAGGWKGRGPFVVVTDLGIWHFDDDGEMRLDFLHPGATLDQIRATIAWEPRISPALATTPAPTAEELRLVREELDPEGVYTK